MLQKDLIIQGQNIYLRVLTQKDATPRYCFWINDPEVNRFLETKNTTLTELKEYIQKRYEDQNCLFFGIFLKKNDLHIGNIKLEPINFEEKKTPIGIIIGEKKYWNKGFATSAINLLKDYAFKNLKLTELFLGVRKENLRAIRVYEKCGFQIYDHNENSYLMNLLREDI